MTQTQRAVGYRPTGPSVRSSWLTILLPAFGSYAVLPHRRRAGTI
ncbi:hypothetical protein [Streptomyces cellostaticus]|nr:hypothetical protein [Streptomyces cellostaticus]